MIKELNYQAEKFWRKQKKGQSSSWDNALQSWSSGHLPWTPIWRDLAHVAWLPWWERRATAGVCTDRVTVRDLQDLCSCLSVQHTNMCSHTLKWMGHKLHFSFLSSLPVGYIFKYHTLCWAEFRFAFYRKGLRVQAWDIIILYCLSFHQTSLSVNPTHSHSLPLAPVCRRWHTLLEDLKPNAGWHHGSSLKDSHWMPKGDEFRKPI